jgi:lipopolysaccharide export system protein LptC
MSQAANLMRDKRQHAALPGGSHDRLVRYLAVALPGGVGLLAAIMILSPLSPRGEISFLLDRNKVQTTNERVRLNAAAYSGEDNRGRPFTVSAGTAYQSTASVPVVSMGALSARLELEDGPAELTAVQGAYNFSAETIAVEGPIRFVAADGYTMSTSHVAIDLNTRRVIGSGGVSGTVPAGAFSAERLVADLGERSVTLDGKARLNMAPGKLRMP